MSQAFLVFVVTVGGLAALLLAGVLAALLGVLLARKLLKAFKP